MPELLRFPWLSCRTYPCKPPHGERHRAKEIREFKEASHATGIIISAGKFSGCIVMCANDNALGGIGTIAANHISVGVPINSLGLFDHTCVRLGKLLRNVGHNPIEILRMCGIARHIYFR